MIDEAHVVSTLAARAIVPDASQRHAIAALLDLLGILARGRLVLARSGHARSPLRTTSNTNARGVLACIDSNILARTLLSHRR